MKKATIEILHEDEVEMGGSFHKYHHDAVNHVKEYQGMETG